MIQFACTCGEPFEVPESEAGDSFQCPTCKRLVDVPMLSDLAAINEDGTLKLDEPEPTPQALAGKMHAFGHQSDMRNSLDDVLKVGVDPSEGIRSRHAPRYDPETGELVVAIDIRPDETSDNPEDIPLASPVLGYSSGDGAASVAKKKHQLYWWNMPWELLTGLSLMAMFFVFLAHAIVAVTAAVPALNIIMILPTFGLFIATVSHYVNTLEDIGPQDRDDVPVFLRGLSLSDDILRPFGNFLLASLYVLVPVILVMALGMSTLADKHLWIGTAIMACAGLAFPAVLFTAVCSGALQNLMPQRAFSVILAAPAQYTLATAAFLAACVTYFTAFENMAYAPVSSLQNAPAAHFSLVPVLRHVGMVLILFTIAIYLMHLAAAWLGLIYRTHYKQLNWVLQRHEPQNRGDTTARLLKRHLDQKNPAVLSEEAKTRLEYVRMSDAARREPQRPTPAPLPTAKILPKSPRGFEV